MTHTHTLKTFNLTTSLGHGRNKMQYPYAIYEYPAHLKIFTSITSLLGEPIVLFTALTAFGAIVAAIAAVRANAPNSREKTDILKCEILNLLQSRIGLEAWVRCASLGESSPAKMAEFLDMERRKQIGILGKIFKWRKYSKYKWRIYIIAALSELQQEGYKNAGIGTSPVTGEDISQWSYEQSVCSANAY